MDYWPRALFPASQVRWRLQNRVINGGAPVVGPGRMSGTIGAGLWVCEMTGIWLYRREQLQAARALDMMLDGGLTSIVVAACEGAYAPWARPSDPVSHSDGSPFSDATFYAGSAPTGTVTANAALRATTVTMNLPAGASLIGGEAFSIRHPVKGERRYQISRVDGAQVTFRPELREAVTSGTAVHFHDVGCVMRLANPDDFFSAIRSGQTADLSPTFVEAF